MIIPACATVGNFITFASGFVVGAAAAIAAWLVMRLLARLAP